MTKKGKKTDMDLYYMDYGQAEKQNKNDNFERKKKKEREKKIN